MDRLRGVWQRRVDTSTRGRVDTSTETSWKEDRIARITGTTASHFRQKATVPAHAVKKMFGLVESPQTKQIEIGVTLEKAVLDAFCRAHTLTLSKNRAGLVLLAGSSYVGHTPDAVVYKPSKELLEVKVVFPSVGDEVDVKGLRKKHNDQMQLGMKVHKCSTGRLIVYPCQPELTLKEVKSHKVDSSKFVLLEFTPDREWWQYFEINAQVFYSSHLEWFYGSVFDEKKAGEFVESVLNTKKRKL